MTIEFKFADKELDNLVKTIRGVSADMRYKGSQFALRKAAQPVLNSVRADAQTIDDPESREQIFKNVAAKWSLKFYRRTGDQMYRIGILGGAKSKKKYADSPNKDNPGGDTFYWRWVNFGTVKTKGKFFFGNQLELNGQKATAEYVKHFQKYLERAIKRERKKAGLK